MSKANPNWGKPEVGPVVVELTLFEKKVAELQLQPDEYVTSEALRVWVREHRNTHYVPEPLLEAWGFVIDTSF
jgi:hypothetical protein